MIFVVLPAAKRGKAGSRENLSDRARRFGVPGIPVDAGDAVALYRVAQESMGRIRGGDGPVLIECLEFHRPAKGKEVAVDPLVQLGDILVRRKVCTKAWQQKAGDKLRRRIMATRH
jgi:TPP-dependent pyruvate/acetoin dehydrogenase alpha subunit